MGAVLVVGRASRLRGRLGAVYNGVGVYKERVADWRYYLIP